MGARQKFHDDVMKRDGGCCVICDGVATEAHHIMDRKLFPDGGYVLDNGAAVCETCHIMCETTEVTCSRVRAACDIKMIVLPSGFKQDRNYDKWGNLIYPSGLRRAGPLADDDGCRRALERGGYLDKLVREDGLPLPDWVGYSALNTWDWADWRSLVHRLHAASQPGAPLDGWLFHGTSSEKAEKIAKEGMCPTQVMRRDDAGQYFVDGSFWGTALTAAWYAEDDLHMRVEEGLGIRPVILAAPVHELDAEGKFIPDEATIDFPSLPLHGMTSEEIEKEWAGIGIDTPWRKALSLTGAVALLHKNLFLPPSLLELARPDDVDALTELASMPSTRP